MQTILISYRRSDSSAFTGRIFDRLTSHYGKEAVFMDVDNIPIGIDFRSHIDETLLKTGVLIAVIGANWLGENTSGRARITEKTDPVRVEIATALARKIPIIPVLIDGAKMPESSKLPPEFGNFVFLNAADVSAGRDFHPHMERLIAAIDRTLGADLRVASARQAATSRRVAAENAPGPAARSWLTDTSRYFIVPLVVLLGIHHIVVNAFNLRTVYLWAATAVVPFVFGAAFSWLGRRSTGPAIGFAITLGVFATAGMTLSQSLSSGDPIMPQTRFEWWDNFNFTGVIALSFLIGHALARALYAVTGWKQ